MALVKKGYVSEFGVPQEYWKITAINFNFLLSYGDITVGGYMTKEARDNEYEPLSTRKVRCKWTDDEFFAYFSPEALKNKSFYDRVYEYIKTDEFFKEALDD